MGDDNDVAKIGILPPVWKAFVLPRVLPTRNR